MPSESNLYVILPDYGESDLARVAIESIARRTRGLPTIERTKHLNRKLRTAKVWIRAAMSDRGSLVKATMYHITGVRI